MKLPRLSWIEWLLLAGIAVVIIIMLTGCFSRPAGSLPAGAGASSIPGGPSGVLTKLSLGATALAGTILIACAFLAWFYPDKSKVAKLAVACITILVGSQAVYWLGQHLVLATVLVLLAALVGGCLYAWVHRRALERKLGVDLDQDGKVG